LGVRAGTRERGRAGMAGDCWVPVPGGVDEGLGDLVV
jgi:hypothetical protein